MAAAPMINSCRPMTGSVRAARRPARPRCRPAGCWRQCESAPGSARRRRAQAPPRRCRACASATVRMPPEALKPTRDLVDASDAITRSITPAACGVALTGDLPVLVFRKSAPSASARRAARSIAASSRSSPVSRITFIVRLAPPRRAARSTATQAASSPSSNARYGNTTSTSCAPACTMVSTSRSVRATSVEPSGKLATAATLTAGGTRSRASRANRGHTHTAATAPWWPRARSHSDCTSASVSRSFRLVRSRHASAMRASSSVVRHRHVRPPVHRRSPRAAAPREPAPPARQPACGRGSTPGPRVRNPCW